MTQRGSAAVIAEAIAREPGLVLILTGAGVSLASGIPTFRGADEQALWKADVTELATYRFFRRDPVRSWQWYRSRFARAAGAKPNPAHVALAQVDTWLAARDRPFLLITQNIDTLHEQAGTRRLIKVHGSADRVRCAASRCASHAAGATTLYAEQDFAAFDRNPSVANLPRCAACGDVMRPHVLWFDEMYTSHADYGWPTVMDACAAMRLVIAVGTSFSVGITDLIDQTANERGVPMFVIDPDDVRIGARTGAVHVREQAEELLPHVCAELPA